MAVQRTSFGKLQRDRAKKAKAAAKRERRQERAAASEEDTPEVVIEPEGGELSAAELLTLIEAIHRRFDDGAMTFEEFEEKKAELMARLSVD